MPKTVCQSVAWFKRYKTLKSVTVGRSGRSVGRSLGRSVGSLNLRKLSYSAKTRSASASLVINTAFPNRVSQNYPNVQFFAIFATALKPLILWFPKFQNYSSRVKAKRHTLPKSAYYSVQSLEQVSVGEFFFPFCSKTKQATKYWQEAQPRLPHQTHWHDICWRA